MSPRVLLRLWRERWGKSVLPKSASPFVDGHLNQIGNWLTYLSAWSVPGLTVLAALCCIWLAGLLLVVQFSLDDQIIFSASIICLALYARRYAGHFVTLLLMGLGVVVSARYLYWRLIATLAPQVDADFVLGFCLCLAELHLWLLTMTGTMKDLWPVRKVPIALPAESAGWPPVDVFILCDDQTVAATRASAEAAQALSWPKRILKVHLLDSGLREEIKALADSLSIAYLVPENPFDDRTSRINQALTRTEGNLITILECHSSPATDLLKTIVGWFQRDTDLAMLQTPGHFLAPAPSASVMEIFEDPQTTTSCACVRRSMLAAVDGIESGPATRQRHTALKLQAAGYTTGYLGFAGDGQGSLQEAFMAYRPFGDYSLLWKLRLHAFHSMLRFFRPLPRLVLVVAPAAYLLFDIRLIQTSAALLLACALPHLVLTHITAERRHAQHHFGAVTDLREALLSWYILFLTAISLLWTEITEHRKNWREKKKRRVVPFDWKAALAFLAILGLNLSATVSAVTQLLISEPKAVEMYILFTVLAAYNVMLLAAMLAVAEEARAIQLHTQGQARLPAMIRLPSGRTVSCTTENFPEMELALKLPMPVTLEDQMTVNISIFRGNHEFSFPAPVVLEPDLVLRARIDGPAQTVYRSLAVAAYSRGQDWPKWLPGRDVDHPLPRWLQKSPGAPGRKPLGFVLGFGRFLSMKFGSGRMKKGKMK